MAPIVLPHGVRRWAAGLAIGGALVVALAAVQTAPVSFCTDPSLTWLSHEGWDTPDSDGLVHHQHVEGCVPLGKVYTADTGFVQHVDLTLVLFRKSATGVLKALRFEAGPVQVFKTVNPDETALTCTPHTAGEVCTLPVSTDVDFSADKCSGPQRLNIRLVYDSPTGFPAGEMETASTYTIDVENGAPPCGASVNPYTIGTGWQKEHINALALNHRYPTAGVRQDQVLAAAHAPIAYPWVVSVLAHVGPPFSASDPAHGANIAVDPMVHDGSPGCVILDGPPLAQPTDVTIVQADGTLPCLVPQTDGTFGPAVTATPLSSGWHTLAIRATGTHDTVDNPGMADHLAGHSVSAGNFKIKFDVP